MSPDPASALLVIGGLSIITLAVFGGLLGGLKREGGKARVDFFGLPELLVALVLAGLFAGLVVKATFNPRPDRVITLDQVLPNAGFFLVLFAGIAGFLHYRGVKLWSAFGGDRVSLPRALALGFGLLLAVFPAVVLGNLIMQVVLQQKASEQELIALFREAARAGNRGGVGQIFLAGAVIAPICEEFLFRGFFYGVGKRYLGAWPSALLVSLLFAAFHVNLAAFPSLCILALGLTVAYESTGSLLVPVCMHALFNGSQLAFLYLATIYAK